MQGLVYFFLILEIIMYCDLPPLGFFDDILARIRAIPIYNNIFFSKLLILFLEILRSIGFQYGKYNHTIGNESNKILCILDIYCIFRFCQWRYANVAF